MVSTSESVDSEKPQEAVNAETTENDGGSDEQQEKIQKLKAEIRENTEEPVSNGVANGNHEEVKENEAVVQENQEEVEEEGEEPKDEKDSENGEQKVEETNGNGSESKNEEEEVANKEEEPEVMTIDDDEDEIKIVQSSNGDAEEKAETPAASTSKENGESSGKGVKRDSDEIVLDDDEDEESSAEPPSKKSKVEEDDDIQEVPSNGKLEEKKTEKKEPQLTSSEKLLDKLEEYVMTAINANQTVNRKVLDALLGAINVQVQREPMSVRSLILEKKLVLPNTISLPPSQVVELLIEHDADHPVGKVCTKMFGEEKPRYSEAEKKEKVNLKASVPTPHMTKVLMDIGQDLVQEATYCDIVNAKNLPEIPKDYNAYKTVSQQLKPVWEQLKKKNEPYKLKIKRCKICGFQTESNLVLQSHLGTIHNVGNKYQCALCNEFDTNEQRMIEHYFERHLVVALPEEKESKYPCAICEEDFNFKGQREQHYKQCKKDYIRVRHIMMPKQDDFLMVNRWLWEKPPIDPSILAQQQHSQQQQQKQLVAQQIQAAKRTAALQHQQILKKQQQQQNQQQMLQLQQFMQKGGLSNPSFVAAMANSMRRSQMSPAAQAQFAAILQKQLQTPKGGAGNPAMNSALASAALKSMAGVNVKSAPSTPKSVKAVPSASAASSSAAGGGGQQCEICDQHVADKHKYLYHLQAMHKQMIGKTYQDMSQGAPLACSRCRDRFWTYEGLERHLVMSHGLVTADLLQKAQKKEDGGRCKLCGKQYAFNMLQHLVADHQVKLCSAEIMYSCDVCSFKCTSYQTLESHLASTHPKGDKEKAKGDDCITLDD